MAFSGSIYRRRVKLLFGILHTTDGSTAPHSPLNQSLQIESADEVHPSVKCYRLSHCLNVLQGVEFKLAVALELFIRLLDSKL